MNKEYALACSFEKARQDKQSVDKECGPASASLQGDFSSGHLTRIWTSTILRLKMNTLVIAMPSSQRLT